MIYCPGCGTANRDGSRFCNECGTKLPTMTSSLCPTCGTPNPPHSLFCEKCGTRLIASLAEEPEEQETSTPSTFVPKGLSLPMIGAEPAAAPSPLEPQKPTEPVQPVAEEMPDWMQVVQSAVTGTSELDIAKATAPSSTSDQAAPEEVPAWLNDLGLADQSAAPQKPGTDELLPEWAQRLRTMPETAQPSPAEEEVPDWLKTLGRTGQLPEAGETPAGSIPAATTETPTWMTNLGAPVESAPTENEELPEWLKEPATPYFSTEPNEPPPSPVAPAQPVAEEMPDWLRDLRPVASAEEALPDWLDDLGAEEQPASESTALSVGDSALDWLSQLGATAPEAPATQAAEPSDWMSSLRAAAPEVGMPAIEETPASGETPDWMSSFRMASVEPTASADEEEGVPDWLRATGLAETGAAPSGGVDETQPPAEPPASLKPVTDWLSALRQATPEMEAGPTPTPTEEVPDWMSVVSAGETQPAAQAEEEIPEWLRQSAASQVPTPSEEEGIPDWLKEAGLVSSGAAAVSETEKAQPPEPQKPVTDWLSSLRQATPEMEAEQAPAEEVPEWMREETGTAPQAIGEPQTTAQEVPEWLREASATAQPSAPEEEEIPEWLRETRSSFEPVEEQPAAQAEAENVPDWLRGFAAVEPEAAAPSTFEEVPPAPQKPPTDWLSALRQATPEMGAEQPAAAATPDWLREEPAAAPQAFGEPQAYEQEVPEWLREAGAVAAPLSSQPEEAGVPNWLREESGATLESTPTPAAAQAEEGEGVPDWLRDLGGAAGESAAVAAPRAEEPADEGLPEWLRQEPKPAAKPELSDVPDWLREEEPAPALTFETSQAEEAAPGETPDWLRELTPTAAGAAMAAAEPEAEEPEEIEIPEEVAEAEPEVEGGVSAAAPLAAVVGAAKKPEMAEAAPAEIPDWLKEIRQEQQVAQQATRKAIPVPPSEMTGLTQAEIPAWLEALRPTEEAEAPPGTEAPLEMEGPLAGIANALPPAPVMGEIQGLPAKLQFAVTAEDQARAGVLKELLTQHAVAPAAVEHGAAKDSVWRRRILRWVVATLLIVGILLTKWIDLNQVAPPLQLVPKVQKMVPPQYVRNAAFQISEMAQQPPGAKVLVVFDYDATQAGELNRVAAALLRSPALGNTQIEVASLNPQGSAVAQRVAQMVLRDLPDFKYTDLGFKPGQVNGVQSLLNQAKADDVKLIIALAASPETVRWWTEQMKVNGIEIPVVAGVSAGAEPLTMPYLQSGQVKGLVSGLPGEMMYLKATGVMDTMNKNDRQRVLNDYQAPLDGLALANYIMVALIIVGLVGALLRSSGRRSA